MDPIGLVRTNPWKLLGWGSGYVALLLVMALLSVGGCSDDAVKTGDCTAAWLRGNPFWGSFYSNLMSTFVGAGLGLWAALWLSRKPEEAQRARERDAEDRQRQTREAEARDRHRAEQAAEERRAAAEHERSRDQYLALLKIVTEDAGNIRERMNTALAQAEMAVSGDRIDNLLWTAMAHDVMVELPRYGDQGVDVARQLSRFYSIMPAVQIHRDRVVDYAFAIVAGVPKVPALGSPFAVMLQNNLIHEFGRHVERADLLLVALAKLEEAVRRS
jgi:hypothetical protein